MNGSHTAETTALSIVAPLCRRYRCAVFRTVYPTVISSADVRQHAILWALGFSRDGDREVLGLWRRPLAGSPFSAELIADLDSRGIERLDSVVGPFRYGARPEGEELPHGARALPSIEDDLAAAVALVAQRYRVAAASALRSVVAMRGSAALLDSLGRFEHEPWARAHPSVIELLRVAIPRWVALSHLPALNRRAIADAERIADEMHGGLVRAVELHGFFADDFHALRFVRSWLMASERRRWRTACGTPDLASSDRFGRHPQRGRYEPSRVRPLRAGTRE